jgi:LuxR family maltose regulon positive regulatory protein
LAWIKVDASDNDPVRLWTYVATAVDRVREGLGRGALRRLRVPGTAIEGPVDELLNGMAAFDGDLIVVLDDLHLVTEKQCLASIDHALALLSPNVRIAVTTRADPALKLGRLRADGRLAELRASDLAFSAAEASELLANHADIEIGREDIDVLVERTEGWPAALVLAGLWLRTVEDPPSAVRRFGGDHRFMADYLSGEVVASLHADQRSFLYGISVLGECTAELCDAVFDRSDSAAQLRELERSNLLVTRLESSGWFRIHSLLAEYARAQLATLDPGASTRLRQRAAAWLREHELPVEAIGQAAAAGDHDFVAEVLVEYHLPLIRGGAGGTLLRWVRSLPDECVIAHPRVAIAAAIAALLEGGNILEQRRFLALADRARYEGDDDRYVEAWTLAARALAVEGGVAQAVDDSRRAIDVAQTQDVGVLSGALLAHARALFFAGDLDQATVIALRVLEQPGIEQRTPTFVLTHATLALTAVERGQVASARGHAEKARAAAGRIGSRRSWLGANASGALGAVLAAEGKHLDAERELVAAERFFRDEVPSLLQAWLLVQIARVRVRRGHLVEAKTALHSARAALSELPTDRGSVSTLAREVERELSEAQTRARKGEVLESPTRAEVAVLQLLIGDLSAREIGERLFLSQSTIRSHTRSLYRKLGVHSREEAVARATALGWIDANSSG